MQTCPICHRSVEPSERHPRYLCRECAAQAKTRDGRSLRFFNEALSGGYVAQYSDTGEPYESHECYVYGVLCHADEGRFGGIVIEMV